MVVGGVAVGIVGIRATGIGSPGSGGMAHEHESARHLAREEGVAGMKVMVRWAGPLPGRNGFLLVTHIGVCNYG